MLGVSAVAELAALIGDPARASILYALRDDGRVSSGELAAIAGVAPSTVSEHLAKLAAAGLIHAVPMGRRRYYRLSSPDLSDLLDGIEQVSRGLAEAAPAPPRLDAARVHARACMDHVAGELGGRLAGAAAERGFLRHTATGPVLTEQGDAWLAALGADAAALRAAPRRLVGLCRDWSSDLPHLGGAVGSAVMRGYVAAGWLRHERATGLVRVTPKGRGGLRREFGIDLLGE